MEKYHFASDNTSGICPEAWQAMQEAGAGFCPSYGTDPHTNRACAMFRDFFETDCEVFFVFNGTAANSLALASLCQSYHSIIVHESSHVETDECGAPEFFSNGTKLLLASGPDGKLTPESVEKLVTRRSDIHYPRPRAISLSQPTELGTRYHVEEIRALTSTARAYGLKTHMDGARLFHALAATGLSPADMTWRAGIDVLCLGGTKAGIGLSEAVIFFDRSLALDFEYRCKQAGQLASKMRYMAAPWVAMIQDGAWLRYSRDTLRLASLLGQEIAQRPGLRLLHPVEANSVFVSLPPHVDDALREKGWRYYHFIGGGARFMCSWQTREEDVRDLLRDMDMALSPSLPEIRHTRLKE